MNAQPTGSSFARQRHRCGQVGGSDWIARFVNLLRKPGSPYILAFILTIVLAALTYHFNSLIANFVVGAGLLALVAGIAFIAIDVAKHHSGDSEAG